MRISDWSSDVCSSDLTIVFAEDVGLIQDFDLACCRRAIAFMVERAESSPVNLAVNLSGLSLQSDVFVETLMGLLQRHGNLAGRLMFEATESSRMHDLERAAREIGRAHV